MYQGTPVGIHIGPGLSLRRLYTLNMTFQLDGGSDYEKYIQHCTFFVCFVNLLLESTVDN